MATLLIVAIVVAAVPVIAEVCARIYVRCQRYRVLHPGRIDDMSVDTEVLPRLDARAVFRVNSIGERGDEPPPGAFRILAVGGSAVECYLLDHLVAWPRRIQTRLQEAGTMGGRPVYVGNVGKSGVDSGALLTTVSRLLPQERGIDVLLIMVGASDILRWMVIGAPPDRGAESMTVEDCFARHPDGRFSWRPKGTALATLYRWHRDSLPKRRSKAGKHFGVTRAMRAQATQTITQAPDASHVIARFASNLREMIRLARPHARRIVVVRQPWFRKHVYDQADLAQFWNGSVGDPYFQKCTVYYSPEVLSQLLEGVDAAAASVSAECNVECLDLSADLPPSDKYFYDQIHVTPAGSAIVADAIAEFLARKSAEK